MAVPWNGASNSLLTPSRHMPVPPLLLVNENALTKKLFMVLPQAVDEHEGGTGEPPQHPFLDFNIGHFHETFVGADRGAADGGRALDAGPNLDAGGDALLVQLYGGVGAEFDQVTHYCSSLSLGTPCRSSGASLSVVVRSVAPCCRSRSVLLRSRSVLSRAALK